MTSTEIATYDASRGSMAAITGGHLIQFQDWAKVIAHGSVIPDSLRGKPADVFVCVMHGLDLGLRPMQALNMVYVVKGRPSLSAEGMRALLHDQGHEFRIDKLDTTGCQVSGRRKGTEVWHTASFTDEQRKKAKLNGANWDAYAEDMLLARATTRLCKRYFSDVTNGLSSVEEILDEQPGTSVTLAAAVQQREAATISHDPVTGVVDDDSEKQRLADAVADIAAQHAPEPVDAEIVPEDPPYVDGADWPEAAKPAGA